MVVPTTAGGPVRSVDELVARAAAADPDAPALVAAGGPTLAWAALEDQVARVATGLGRAGVVAGYRVALVLPHRVELVVGYLGTLRARAVACPLDPRADAAALRGALVGSGARMVVVDASTLGVVRDAVAGLHDPAPRVVVVGAEPAAGELAWDRLHASPRPVPGEPDWSRWRSCWGAAPLPTRRAR